jgi:hypothetical protein
MESPIHLGPTDPYRYVLFFHPGLPTGEKYNPLHLYFFSPPFILGIWGRSDPQSGAYTPQRLNDLNSSATRLHAASDHIPWVFVVCAPESTHIGPKTPTASRGFR